MFFFQSFFCVWFCFYSSRSDLAQFSFKLACAGEKIISLSLSFTEHWHCQAMFPSVSAHVNAVGGWSCLKVKRPHTAASLTHTQSERNSKTQKPLRVLVEFQFSHPSNHPCAKISEVESQLAVTRAESMGLHIDPISQLNNWSVRSHPRRVWSPEAQTAQNFKRSYPRPELR